MAKRVVFESKAEKPYYTEKNISFELAKGFAKSQKQKNIQKLHEMYIHNFHGSQPLEVSTKSMQNLGVQLSAFNLKTKDGYVLENVFQSSKKFESGGPYADLLNVKPNQAKKDERLKTSGKLVSFEYKGVNYPLIPRSAFYDWIYLNALLYNEDLCKELDTYSAFTDIEFNPEKSINCQARATAIYVGLKKAGKLKETMSSFDKFKGIYD